MNNELKVFEKWLIDNGAKIDSLIMQNKINDEREVVSKYNLKANSNVVKIPKKLIITDEYAEDTYYGQCLLNGDHSKINNLGITLVAIYMLTTFNTDCFFKPYYDILPTDINNFPIFWSKKELLQLQGSDILNKISDRIKSFKNDYGVIVENCPGFKEQFPFKQFVYIRTLIGSRNFGININGKKRVAMIPFADMLNHDASPSTNWYFSQSDDCFHMDMNRSVQANIEITDTYGKKCNSKYLLFYGFVLPNNDNNKVTVKLKQNTDDLDDVKNNLYTSLTEELDKDLDSYAFRELLKFLRISAATPDELSDKHSKNDFDKPLNKNNEYKALRNLYLLIEHLERNYVKSYTDLKKRYKKTTPFTKNYTATVYILGELDILLFYKNLAYTFMKQLKGGKNKPNNKYKIYQTIINSIIT
jgi:histone-lysine N-methyltransferase SETD3